MTASSPARRTVDATAWMAAGRGLGILWRVVIVAALGIADFGVYAVVLAVAALISMPLEAYYVVREPRTSAEVFSADRAARWWLGVAGALIGAVVAAWAVLPGLVLLKAGIDMMFNAYCSAALRDGRPEVGHRLDTTRQAIGVAAASAYLFTAADPSIEMVLLLSVLAAAPFGLLAWSGVRGVRPAAPERSARSASIVGEACGAAAYIQGDIVLLAAIAGPEAAGYYSFGSVVVWVLALVGRNLAVSYHHSLREADGHVTAGPPLRHTATLAAIAGAAVAVIAVLCLVAGAPADLWLTFAVLVPVAASRVFAAVLSTVLALQERDHVRLVTTVVGVALKLGLIVVLAACGAVGAAVAFLVADLVVTAWLARALYRPEVER